MTALPATPIFAASATRPAPAAPGADRVAAAGAAGLALPSGRRGGRCATRMARRRFGRGARGTRDEGTLHVWNRRRAGLTDARRRAAVAAGSAHDDMACERFTLRRPRKDTP